MEKDASSEENIMISLNSFNKTDSFNKLEEPKRDNLSFAIQEKHKFTKSTPVKFLKLKF